MCPLHALEVIVVAAKHVGCDGQMLKLRWAERKHTVSPRERPESTSPRPMRHGLAALFDCVEWGHRFRA
jgi:hypothetical protein